jgi:hypothetical protein
MAIDIDKAIQAINDVDDAYYRWLRKQLSEWMDEYIGGGIDENDPSTFDQDDIDALKIVLEKLASKSHAQLYGEIEDILAVMALSKEGEEEEEEENETDEAEDGPAPIQSPFDLEEFQSQLEAEGWMNDDEWKKFGIRQGGDCISEKVMMDIASRWDDDRLKAFPEHSKFQYTDRELPPGHAHYIMTTFEWKVIMGRFSSVASMPFSTGDNPSFVMWKLENGKNYVDWCKRSKLRKNEG